MSLTKDALQYINDLALSSQNLYENKDTVFKVLRNEDGDYLTHELPKDPVSRSHKFSTLEGFLDYLKSDHCKEDKGIIFVSPDLIYADLEYGEHGQQNISLKLTHSEEYMAFLSICHVGLDEAGLVTCVDFIPQKELCRALISSLANTIDASFCLQIQNICLGKSNKTKFEIDNSGITSTNKQSHVSVTVIPEKDKSTTMPFIVDWTWTGRIWECFAKEYEIPFRVEIEALENGIGLICHPKKMQTVLRQARQDLIDELNSKIPKTFTVHEGQY